MVFNGLCTPGPIHSFQCPLEENRREEERAAQVAMTDSETFESQCQNTKQWTFSRRSANVVSKSAWQLVADCQFKQENGYSKKK